MNNEELLKLIFKYIEKEAMKLLVLSLFLVIISFCSYAMEDQRKLLIADVVNQMLEEKKIKLPNAMNKETFALLIARGLKDDNDQNRKQKIEALAYDEAAVNVVFFQNIKKKPSSTDNQDTVKVQQNIEKPSTSFDKENEAIMPNHLNRYVSSASITIPTSPQTRKQKKLIEANRSNFAKKPINNNDEDLFFTLEDL